MDTPGRTTRRFGSEGFTLIELMVVVVVIGILAAIAIPNFLAMQDRAKEGSVKSNMHTLQLAVEDFAVQNDGTYPLAADDASVKANIPNNAYPENPFSGNHDAWVWNADPAASGVMGLNPATVAGYTIKGYGKSALLTLLLTNGA